MRGKKAKALRRADPSRPNPGRKHGGSNKDQVERHRYVMNYGKRWDKRG